MPSIRGSLKKLPLPKISLAPLVASGSRRLRFLSIRSKILLLPAIALAGLLGPAGLDSPQTLQITLDNALTSEPSQGVGLIRKTYVGFRIETRPNAVPEPSALALMLGGVLAAVLAGRRRRL